MDTDDEPNEYRSSNLSLKVLQHLSQEFDCLGLPTINVHVDVLDQLLTSIYGLISLYRKTLTQNKESNLKEQALIKEQASQQKSIQKWKDVSAAHEFKIGMLEDALRKKQLEIDSLVDENRSLHKDLEISKNVLKGKEKDYYHMILTLKMKNQELKERLGDEIGNFTSVDKTACDLLMKYKAKESIYEDTIQKLQQNNESLLSEVLTLKEEVVMAITRNE